MVFSQKWNIDNFFKNGSSSEEFIVFLGNIKNELIQLSDRIKDPASLKACIQRFQTIHEKMEEASSFISCLIAQDVNDKGAENLQYDREECQAILTNVSSDLDELLSQLPEADFSKLLQDPDLKPIAFLLQERRVRRKEKLPLPMERLITDLSVDGYHAWSHLYGTFIGHEVIPVTINGRKEELSWGQAYNRLSDPNRDIRKEVFQSSNQVWKAHESIYGAILNHISGHRLTVYGQRGWHFLKEPLDMNRLSEAALNTLWKVISENKAPFIECLKGKARLLGLEKLSWYDLEAPLGNGESTDSIMGYEEGSQFIIDQFHTVAPRMAAFAQKALKERWVEAEYRKGKRPGGFCTGFPMQKQSRIFMTYSGTNESLFTLAHELGHAFHNEIIYQLPEMARHFPMNLAETASTFAEMVISEAAYSKATDPKKKMQLLNAKLQRSLVFLCNIHSRFLFESRMYEERKKGTLSGERLCQLMEEAQKEAYGNALEEYHPWFWASKMHFNITEVPFYNFPYTFGYLFSTAIYHWAKESHDFERLYIDLLSDTGRMTTEDLAKKHLKADLTQPAFWQSILDILKQDAHEFLRQ